MENRGTAYRICTYTAGVKVLCASVTPKPHVVVPMGVEPMLPA